MEIIDEGLVFDGMLPVTFNAIHAIPQDAQLAFINEGNESFLRANLVWQEPIDVDEHDEVSAELRRQDLKISLLMDMVGELLAHQNSLPIASAVKLTSKGIECEAVCCDYGNGQQLEVALYISPGIPKPLRIFGKVNSSKGDRVSVSFIGLNQAVTDQLEKIIFRHHRRTVAQGRTVPDPTR